MAEGIKKLSENVVVADRALVITNPLLPDNDAISIGALQSDPALRGLKIKTSKGVYSLLDAAQILETHSITNNLLGPECVTSDKIAPNAVGHDQIADDSVCEWKLREGSVVRDKIKNLEVVKGKLGLAAVETINLEDECVTNPKIAINTIENSRLANKTILNTKIADGTLIESLYANQSVSESKIKNDSVTNIKIKDREVYGNKIGLKAVKNEHLDTNSVNTVNILNGAVNKDKLGADSVLSVHVTEKAILNKHLFDEVVTKNKLSKDSVSTDKIINKNVTKEKLADDVLTYIGDPVQYDKNNNVTLRPTSNLTVPGNIEANGTITAKKIYNAVFMDIAEAYEPKKDEIFVPGDIVQVNEEGKLQRATASGCQISGYPIVGVVSDEYAACYGATEEELENGTKIAVGMIGKVHVNVVGPVKLGDKIGLCKEGFGASVNTNNIIKDYVVGKALETNEEFGLKKVLCLIYPN